MSNTAIKMTYYQIDVVEKINALLNDSKKIQLIRLDPESYGYSKLMHATIRELIAYVNKPYVSIQGNDFESIRIETKLKGYTSEPSLSLSGSYLGLSFSGGDKEILMDNVLNPIKSLINSKTKLIIDSTILESYDISISSLIDTSLRDGAKILIIGNSEVSENYEWNCPEIAASHTKSLSEFYNDDFMSKRDRKQYEIVASYLLNLDISKKLIFSRAIRFSNIEGIMRIMTKLDNKMYADIEFVNKNFNRISIKQQYELLMITLEFDPFNNELLRLFSANDVFEVKDFLQANEIVRTAMMTNTYDSTNIRSKELKEIVDGMIKAKTICYSQKASALYNLYRIFINIDTKEHVGIKMHLGTYLYSELINNNLMKEGREVKNITLQILNRPYSAVSRELVQEIKRIFIMKDTVSYNIEAYHDVLNEVLDSYGAFKTNDYSCQLGIVSNYLGMAIFDKSAPLKLAMSHAERWLKLDAAVSKNHKRVINNISILTFRDRPELVDELYCKFVKIENPDELQHPILLNNALGLLMNSSEIDNKVEEVTALFQSYKKVILADRSGWFYNFFFNMNLKIFKEKFDSLNVDIIDSINVDMFDVFSISKLYENTDLGDFYKYMENKYLGNGTQTFDKCRLCYEEYCDYEYPFNYLFIDYQKWD